MIEINFILDDVQKFRNMKEVRPDYSTLEGKITFNLPEFPWKQRQLLWELVSFQQNLRVVCRRKCFVSHCWLFLYFYN